MREVSFVAEGRRERTYWEVVLRESEVKEGKREQASISLPSPLALFQKRRRLGLDVASVGKRLTARPREFVNLLTDSKGGSSAHTTLTTCRKREERDTRRKSRTKEEEWKEGAEDCQPPSAVAFVAGPVVLDDADEAYSCLKNLVSGCKLTKELYEWARGRG